MNPIGPGPGGAGRPGSTFVVLRILLSAASAAIGVVLISRGQALVGALFLVVAGLRLWMSLSWYQRRRQRVEQLRQRRFPRHWE